MIRTLDDLEAEMRAVARGDSKAPPVPTTPFQNSVFSADTVILINLIHQHEPDNIPQLAEISGQPQWRVCRSLQNLAQHGIVRMERDGDVVRPVLTTRHSSPNLDYRYASI